MSKLKKKKKNLQEVRSLFLQLNFLVDFTRSLVQSTDLFYFSTSV